jgi:outer membrane protein with beta-barrel domain
MRLMIIGSLLVGALVAAPARTAAQERVPTTGTVAAGIDVGAFIPNDDGLSNSMLLNFLYEYYVTPRVSVRADFGWSNPSFNAGGVDSLRQLPLRFDVNYNWEGGRWHPFVGTGVGVYFMQFRANDETIGDTETKFGLNTGGGIEYFLNRSVALKGEGRYHAIANARGMDPSGLALTAGLKTYF